MVGEVDPHPCDLDAETLDQGLALTTQ